MFQVFGMEIAVLIVVIGAISPRHLGVLALRSRASGLPAIDLIEQRQALLRAAAPSTKAVSILGVLLREGRGGPFLDELVVATWERNGTRLMIGTARVALSARRPY